MLTIRGHACMKFHEVQAIVTNACEMGKQYLGDLCCQATALVTHRVATIREKYLENKNFSRTGKSQIILLMAREI